MKIQIVFKDNRVTVKLLLDGLEASSSNQLEAITRHLTSEATRMGASVYKCQIIIPAHDAKKTEFEIIANLPDQKQCKVALITFLKELVADLKKYDRLNEAQFNQIKNIIEIEFARDFCEAASSDIFVTRYDATGPDVCFIKTDMQKLIAEADDKSTSRERLQTVVSNLKTLIDDYENATKGLEKSKSLKNISPSKVEVKAEVKEESISVGELLLSIGKMLTDTKKFIHDKITLKKSIYQDEAYNFLDQIGPKNKTGAGPDFTPLDQAIPVNKTMSPALRNVNQLTGREKIEELNKLLDSDADYKKEKYEFILMSSNNLKRNVIEVKCQAQGLSYRVIGFDNQEVMDVIPWDELPKDIIKEDREILTGGTKLLELILRKIASKHISKEPDIRTAFDACIELVILYDRLYKKSQKEIVKKSDTIAVKCPVTSFQSQKDFEGIKDWAYALRLRGSLSDLPNKSVEEIKYSQERHSTAPLATKPVSSAPPKPVKNGIAKQAPNEDLTAPLLPQEEKSPSPKINKPSFSQRHPWVVRFAKAGAFVFGALAFVSFFVPIPGLNLTLAGVFSAISAGCGTVAAGMAAAAGLPAVAGIVSGTVAGGAVVGIAGGMVAVGSGVGASIGRLAECTPYGNPSNNAKMHKYLGAKAFAVNGDVDPGEPVATSTVDSEESTVAYSAMADDPSNEAAFTTPTKK